MTDLLNQKIKSTFDKNQDRVLVAGMYGHNSTTDKFDYAEISDNGDLHVNIHGVTGGGDMKARSDIADPNTSTFVKCNTDGTLEMTAELSSAGLATSAIQTDGTQKAMCMGNDSGSQQQILVSNTGVVQTLDSEVFGKTAQIANQTTLSNTNEATLIAQGNRAGIGVGNTSADGTGTNTALLTDANGHLQVDVLTSGTLTITGDAQIKAEDDSASARNIRCNNSGHVKSQLIGNTVGDGSGTNKVVQVNDAGQLKTKLVAEDNTATRRELRCNTTGHLQTALLGNTAGDGSGTIKNVVTDSDGHLQVDVLSGGGGSASNQYNNGGTQETLSVLKPTAPATSLVTPATTILDMTNYKGLQVNITTASASYFDISVAVEFSNVADFSTTLGVAYSDIQTFNQAIDVGSNPISGQYSANILMTPEYNGQQPQAKYARATFNHLNNAGSNISVVINTIQMPH
jgi:hypothetical protein